MDAATALPWVVKLTYTLDGAEIRPDELGGKSGALSIRLQVSRNPDCTGSFFDDYALQVTMSLDTGLAGTLKHRALRWRMWAAKSSSPTSCCRARTAT